MIAFFYIYLSIYLNHIHRSSLSDAAKNVLTNTMMPISKKMQQILSIFMLQLSVTVTVTIIVILMVVIIYFYFMCYCFSNQGGCCRILIL